MARGGVYKSEIAKARNSLMAQGTYPSIDAVRVALGNTGSKSTIHRYLKELEAEEGAGTAGKVAVSDALQDLVNRLAMRLHEEADGLIAEARQRSDAALAKQKDATVQLQQENAELSQQLQRTEVALQEKTEAHTEATQAIQKQSVAAAQLEERVQGLLQQLAERDAHRQSLEDKHEHAREALEHYRRSAKEQRNQDQRRHEHQVQELQVALRQANETIAAKNADLLTLNRDNGRLANQVTELGKAGIQLKEENVRLRHAIGDHEAVVKEGQRLQEEFDKAIGETERVKKELAKAQATMEKAEAGRTAAEAAANKANGRVEALEAVIAALSPRSASDTVTDTPS